ncbi:MAG: hypothetical protein OEU90_00285 [Gammaproteobacteria bacterium]|nr:hypothetical protein [Gammaproteobacteria bacterium]MDH3749234.1 hypothetical protein [Gammaproteobacteria bacterium]MDH3803884.1 hypothetical protein [Gammaproteobacteria bacterium]
MNTAHTALLLAAYLTLVGELIFLHVPSVASTLQILSTGSHTDAGYSERYAALFRYSRTTKILLFVAPIGVIYALFAYPLVVVVQGTDPLGDYLFIPVDSLQTAGAATLVVGRIVTLSATSSIRINNRQLGESFFLHTTGLYKWTRNPGLVGMYLFVAGIWLMMPSLTMAVGIVVYIAYMDFKIRMEEDFLSRKFGEHYDEYRRLTGRYLW